MSTMSAASMAASEPMAPMAMPMSARVSTGASLMPSPTKASLPLPLVSRSRLGEKRLHLGHLVLGKQLGVHLVDAEFGGDGPGHGCAVAREHDGLLHAGRAQIGDGAGGVGLHGVGDDDGAQVGAVGGHVEHGARHVGGREGDVMGRHELAVAHEHVSSRPRPLPRPGR